LEQYTRSRPKALPAWAVDIPLGVFLALCVNAQPGRIALGDR
jgi:hypothetical protein